MVLTLAHEHVKISPAIASPADNPVRISPAAAFLPIPEFDEFGNPPLTDGRAVLDIPGRWHVAACRARHVKAYARDLLRMSRIYDGAIGYFLPMTTINARSNCRHRRKYKSPMFAGTIFVCVADPSIEIDPNHRTLPNYGIRIPDSTQPRFKADLARVELMALNDPDSLEVWPKIREGQKVRVLNGPYRNFEAYVTSLDNKRRKMGVVFCDDDPNQPRTLNYAAVVELNEQTEVEPI